MTRKGERVPAQGYSTAMEDASTSGCTRQLETLELLDTSLTAGGSRKASDNLTAPATKSCVLASAVEERIEQSKSHWSTLAEFGAQVRPPRKWRKLIFCCFNKEDGAVAGVSNVKVFKDLQRHPTWGPFICNQDRFAEFEVGEKFAEGAQAELFHVQVRWGDPWLDEYNRERGIEYVVKVFKKGTFLQDLQVQVPRGYLDYRADFGRKWSAEHHVEVPRFESGVQCGMLLKDGRFAFLMHKEQFDLRYVIERNMKSRSGGCMGPFSKEDAECIMYQVALGVDFLHSHNIIHRDLKASNVFVNEFESGFYPKLRCFVADFESSGGVQGTGFFRAPQILKACKERKLMESPEVFSREADIYSYGMVCYEVLTGKLPFEGHLPNNYDLVLSGQCLVMPDYVEGWTCELLQKCWQFNPTSRPQIREIKDFFLLHSIVARNCEELIERRTKIIEIGMLSGF